MNVNTMTGAMTAEFIPAGGDDAGQTVSQKMEAGGVYAAPRHRYRVRGADLHQPAGSAALSSSTRGSGEPQ